jgi:hypothetical protein
MENHVPVSQEEMIQAIYENTRKTKNYIKWQLIITVALVVIPLVGALVMVPIALQTLTQTYGAAGIMTQ